MYKNIRMAMTAEDLGGRGLWTIYVQWVWSFRVSVIGLQGLPVGVVGLQLVGHALAISHKFPNLSSSDSCFLPHQLLRADVQWSESCFCKAT